MGSRRRGGLVFGVWMVLVLFVAVFGVVLNVRLVWGSGTIYIRADGSIDPPTAPIQRNGELYALTDNIFDSIVVERDNIVIDGAGYTIQGTGNGTGIDLSDRNNLTLKNANIQSYEKGVYLKNSAYCTLRDNSIIDNQYGVTVESIGEVLIEKNEISGNSESGIWLVGKSHVIIKENTVRQNGNGIASDASDTHSGIVIANNTILSNQKNGIYFYSYAYDGYSFISNITFTNNTILFNGENGIYLYSYGYGYFYMGRGYSYIHNVTFSFNTVSSNNASGIRLYSYSKAAFGEAYIYNITFSGNTISYHSGDGIYLNSYNWEGPAFIRHVAFLTNRVLSNGGVGVYLYSYGHYGNSYVYNITFSSNMLSSNSGHGIFINSYGDSAYSRFGYIYSVMFSKNKVLSNAQIGIYLSASGYSSYTGYGYIYDVAFLSNVVLSNGMNGVELNTYGYGFGYDGYGRINNILFSFNTISSNNGDGIRLYSRGLGGGWYGWGTGYSYIYNIKISGNTISSNTWDGVHLYSYGYPYEHGIFGSSYIYNITVLDNKVALNSRNGLYLESQGYDYSYLYNAVISNNRVLLNDVGIYTQAKNHHAPLTFDLVILENMIYANRLGCGIFGGAKTGAFNNTFSHNGYGVHFSSNNNTIYHNNFVNNTGQVSGYASMNIWDDDYPNGGNYWSDYTGVDEYNGPNQDQPGSDGIGDTPYVIDANDRDRYPFMNALGPLLPVSPVADFNYLPERASIGEIITFDASATFDPDGVIESYTWNFGDGNVTTVNTPIITHFYEVVGTNIINLTVTDNNGLTDNTLKSIIVKKSSTITIRVNPTSVTPGSNVTINGTTMPTRVGVDVTISYRSSGGSWATLATVNTDLTGTYTYMWKTAQEGTFEIKASWAGDGMTWPAESDIKTVSVQIPVIYIRPDGSVDPPTAPIRLVGDVYTFTEDIFGRIVVERNNTIMDGSNYILKGVGSGTGLSLKGLSNITIRKINIKLFDFGIRLDFSSDNNIINNNLTMNAWGIFLWYSDDNTIKGNDMKYGSGAGVYLGLSSSNKIADNNINSYLRGIELAFSGANQMHGNTINTGWTDISLVRSDGNVIFHNNFVYYKPQVYISESYNNIWDDGYPSGGNYWEDYIGVDLYRGPYQNETGSDGIGDTPCAINVDNRDRYPLMKPWAAPMDTTPPITTISLSGVMGDNEWFTSNVTATLSAIDDTRVDKTEYSFDNATWTTYTTPFNVTGEESTIIYYKSTDKAGNVEKIKTETIKIDKTEPSGSIIINNDATYTTSTSVMLTLTATDATSGVYQVRFSNDGVWDTEPWETPSLIKSWTLTSGDGTKTVYYQIKDNAGLISTYSDTIVLDTTRPSGSVTIAGGATYTNSTSVTLTLTAQDTASGVAEMRFYTSDNATWSSWEPYATSKSWTLTLGDGTKTIHVQYRDYAGFTSPTYQDTIILDRIKPTVNAGVDQTVNEDTLVTFNASASTDENGIAAYTWSFTDMTPQTLNGKNPTYTFATPGTYTITLKVADPAGNTATDTVVITVLDITKPVANAGQNQTVNVGAIVSFDAGASTDSVGIVSYEWNFGDGTTGTGKTTTHTYANQGTYTVTLTVKDSAGNTATDTMTVTVRSAEAPTPPPTEVFPVWIIGTAIAAIGIAIAVTLLLRKRK